MRKLFISIGFGAFICASSNAYADVATEARFFDAIGRRAYEKGQYEQALDAFQLLQEIAPSHGLLYNIALCADLAGRGDMAFSLYGEYLKNDDPDETRRGQALRRVQVLKGKYALVEIESEPAGAAVYVDRKELGQFGVTPLTLAVAEGDHTLLVEHAGFAPSTLSASGKTGTSVKVAARLTPLYGRVSVNVTPRDAKLSFQRDGVAVPVALEESSFRLPVGRYRVIATAPGYLPVEAQALVGENAPAEVNLGLVPVPRPTGRLLVSASEQAAEVFLDGRRVAVTPATLDELSVGEHTLEVRAGKQSFRRRVRITEGRATYVAAELGTPAP